MGPKNGAQYGAPFKEEEWSDDDDDHETNLSGTSSLCGMYIRAMASALCVPESLCVGPIFNSSGVHIAIGTMVVVADSVPALLEALQYEELDDNIIPSMLGALAEDNGQMICQLIGASE
ncbi:hypothetical protein V6N11_079582 [Hibiscus sabdariffa]|uniref:Uncharacterized protein n=1 Tax=Hibiscus sabdariffa TaxID=183260 RepID=A0ABR2RVT0_9ROSI